jgi:hypothetical protein
MNRKALIIGGILVGGFLLYEVFKTGSVGTRPSTAPRTNSDGSIISGLITPLVGIVTSLTAPTGPQAYGSSAYGQSAANVTPGTYYSNGGNLYYTNLGGEGLSAGAVPNYAQADANPGTSLPPGVYGPPVPVPADAVSGGDDGLVSV